MNEKQPEQPPGSERRSDPPGADNPNAPWARHEEVGDLYRVEISDDGHVERADKLTLRPMVWVGSLADYTAGRLHGEWIDAAQDDQDLHAAVQAMLAGSPEAADSGLPSEEWGIFDHDEFGAYRVGEYEPLERVAAVARGIREHGAAFAAWAELTRDEPDRLADFEDTYLGHWNSAEDWAREVLEDLGLDDALTRAAPHLLGYLTVDYAGWARDAEVGGDVQIEEADGGGVWVFSLR